MPSETNKQAVLLFSCKDTRGIVAEVSYLITTYNGNIINADQHRDPESDSFFMRVAFDISNFSVPREKINQVFEPLAIKFKMDWRIEFHDQPSRMAIMVSKYDHCLYDLILRNKQGELKAEISLILSNHNDLRSIADYFKIPFYHIPVSKDNKSVAEAEQIALMEKNNIDLVVLARYMQVLSPEFVSKFPKRLINIHHSFLPAFIGARPYHQAFERGVKIIGATSHYVTDELDQGPIIEQDVTRISHKDDVDDLIMKGRNLEKIVLSRAVKLHLEHRVLAFGNKTVVFE